MFKYFFQSQFFRSHPLLIIGGIIFSGLYLFGYIGQKIVESEENEMKRKKEKEEIENKRIQEIENKRIQEEQLRFKNYLSILSDDELKTLYANYTINKPYADNYIKKYINMEYDKRFNIK